MKIELQAQLAPEYQAWFTAQVENGRFSSVEEGLNTVFGWFKHEIDDRIDPNEDLSWVKPYLDKADADIAAGRVADWSPGQLLEEIRARNSKHENR